MFSRSRLLPVVYSWMPASRRNLGHAGTRRFGDGRKPWQVPTSRFRSLDPWVYHLYKQEHKTKQKQGRATASASLSAKCTFSNRASTKNIVYSTTFSNNGSSLADIRTYLHLPAADGNTVIATPALFLCCTLKVIKSPCTTCLCFHYPNMYSAAISFSLECK